MIELESIAAIVVVQFVSDESTLVVNVVVVVVKLVVDDDVVDVLSPKDGCTGVSTFDMEAAALRPFLLARNGNRLLRTSASICAIACRWRWT